MLLLIRKMHNNVLLFFSGLDGVINLPVAIPANSTSVLYVQISKIAAIAHMREYDVLDEKIIFNSYSTFQLIFHKKIALKVLYQLNLSITLIHLLVYHSTINL